MAPKILKGSGKPLEKIEVNFEFSPSDQEELLVTLQTRFEQNMSRHQGLVWSDIRAKLEAFPEKFASLNAMEITGGEPDVVGYDKQTGEYLFYDCSPESPDGRRSICYNKAGQAEREKKGVQPAGNAVDLAAAMGIELLDEIQYRSLQELGEFDTRSQSWIRTPADIVERGGGLFCERRFGHVFVAPNTYPCFYSNRGFRGALRI
jgi:hypothetical protein